MECVLADLYGAVERILRTIHNTSRDWNHSICRTGSAMEGLQEENRERSKALSCRCSRT